MSVVAAKVLAEEIIIAADSIIIKEELKRTSFRKLQKIDESFIVGGCGSAEELSMMFDFAKSNSQPEPTTEGIRNFLKDFLDYKKEYIEDSKIENAYLIVVGSRLFEVDEMFVTEINDYTAIGEGEAYALTTMHLGYMPHEAVDVACDLCCFVSKPVISYTIKK